MNQAFALCLRLLKTFAANYYANFSVCIACASRERLHFPCVEMLRSTPLRRSPASGPYIKESF